MTEQQIQNEIRIYLSSKGIINFRCNVGKVKTADNRWLDTGLPKGHSDIYGVLPKTGQIIYIEVKKSGGKPTTEQLNFIKAMKKQGAIAGICYSVQDVEVLLNDI